MSDAASGLATVQNLYILQVQLAEFLQGGVGPKKVEEAKKQLRQFNALLKEADPAYMGGEDVYDELEAMRGDVAAKINKFSARQGTGHRASGKAKKAKTKKVTRRKRHR